MTLSTGARRISQPHHQRGAALLVALLIAALVSITLTSMLQRQSALAGIEWQLRETTQARRILYGAEDWALQILREDARRSSIDHLGEPWAIPLQEGRLADFLKASADSAAASVTHLDNSRVQDVWLSGRIVDAHARYNLMRLALAGAALPQERALWMRVAAQAGLPLALAQEIAARFAPPAAAAAPSSPPQLSQPPLSLAQLTVQVPAVAPWAAALSALVVILPESSTINVNTAAQPVLMALIRGLDDKQAERLIDLRRKAPWRDLNALNAAFVENPLTLDQTQAGVVSRYFIVSARVRLGASGTADAPRASEVSMTTTVERLAPENRIRIVRRVFGAELH